MYPIFVHHQLINMAGKKKVGVENNSKLDSRTLEKRFSSIKESSEDIQNVSKWCLQHKAQYHSIVQAWARALRKGKKIVYVAISFQLTFVFTSRIEPVQ